MSPELKVRIPNPKSRVLTARPISDEDPYDPIDLSDGEAIPDFDPLWQETLDEIKFDEDPYSHPVILSNKKHGRNR
jgi:hypothetical protein